MPLLYLVVAIALMLLGGMLLRENPEPVHYYFRVFGFGGQVQTSIPELIGGSAVVGAAAMLIPYFRQVWLGARDRRRLERETQDLRQDNTALRRDVSNAQTSARLIAARAAEAEERVARLEAEMRPLLTMRRDDAAPLAERPTDGQPRRVGTPAAPTGSRWRRR